MKTIRYWLEYILLMIFFALCIVLPWRLASNMGAGILGFIGPKLAASRKAQRNLKTAIPDADTHTVITGMWRNLGHILAEYPHLKTIAKHHTCIHDPQNILEEFRDDNTAGIIIGAHFSNWEVMPTAIWYQKQLALHPVYRAPNNPMVDRLLHHFRSTDNHLTPFDKSRKGMIGMARAMTHGHHLGMLIDQKYNEGIEVSFFDQPAMTSTAFIELSRRNKTPLAYGYITRQKNGDYTLNIKNKIATTDNKGDAIPTIEILTHIHDEMEQWIRHSPEEWLWLHRRWKTK